MTSTPEPKSCCSSQPPETENKDLGLSAYAPLFVILFAASFRSRCTTSYGAQLVLAYLDARLHGLISPRLRDG